MTAIGLKVVSFSTNLTSRGLMELTVNMVATNQWDESSPSGDPEDPGSAGIAAIGENYN
jgi:hypothetical protein